MRHIADRLHAKGLLLGVYTDISAHECGTGPGSQGYYQIDADTYAHDWQVDYLKVDFCGPTSGPTAGGKVSIQPGAQYAAFKALGDALNATNRSIYYSICPDTVAPALGTAAEWTAQKELGITGFIHCTPAEWTTTERHSLANALLIEYTNTFDSWYLGPAKGGIIGDIDSMLQMSRLDYSVPGSWNDADMLQVCNYGKGAMSHGGGMTLAEYRAHYAVWAILASPLILGVDLRTLRRDHPECLELILNSEIVAVNQAKGAQPPVLISQAARPATNAPDGTLSLVPCNHTAAVGLLPWQNEADQSLRAGGSAFGCLDAYECNIANGTPVQVHECHPNNTVLCGYKNQQWKVGAHSITNVNAGTCLTAEARLNKGRGVVSLTKCDGSTAQNFTLNHQTGTISLAPSAAASDFTTPVPMCLVAGATVPPPGGPRSLDITAQVFARTLGHGSGADIAVLLLNRGSTETTLSVSWTELGLSPRQSMHVRDIIHQSDLPPATGNFNATIGKHDVAFVRLAYPTATSDDVEEGATY
eukprot:COSAG02_NODE_153_length_33128_cov_10.471253_24_plen_530_part_00